MYRPECSHVGIDEVESLFGLIGDSAAMVRIREQVSVAGAYDEPVFIVGETGTGKELIAQAIHGESERRARPLEVVNCGALPEALLATELFGHVAGAFTGATKSRVGRIRAADGSSLLLDEISETGPQFQVAVLRAIELGEVQPVGGDRRLEPTDVRFIATSNRPFDELLGGKTFRKDLCYRLSSFVIEVPPLRRRDDDVLRLAAHFLNQFAARFKKRVELSAEAAPLLLAHDFPGNVRELKQTVFRAFVRTESGSISAGTMRDSFVHANNSPARQRLSPNANYTLHGTIKQHLERIIMASGTNLSEAARLLEIPRSTLQHYTEKYEIDVSGIRQGARERLRSASN